MENGDALYARIAELEEENEKLKEKTKEYEAVECFIMKTWRSSNYDCDVALYAHYREGKVIDGKWVNYYEYENSDKDEDSEDEDKDKDKKDGNELSFLSLAAGIINEAYRQQEEGQLLSQ
jgi:hypothetical protein